MMDFLFYRLSILYFQLFAAIYFENFEDLRDFVLLKFSTSYFVTSNMLETFNER